MSFTVKKLNIPSAPGCYFFKRGRKIIYIGKAADLRRRILSYWRPGADHAPTKQLMLEKVSDIDWLVTDSEIDALLLEANLIKKHQPEYNVIWRDDKRYLYVQISTADEIPGVFITRRLDKSGRYFGPYISAAAVKETLKAIRMIWPYCTCRKIQLRPCFYYQIGRCLGVCGGLISRSEYKERVIKPIILFLSGHKNRIIKSYEKKIKDCRAKIKSGRTAVKREAALAREADFLANRLRSIKKVLAHAKVVGVSEKYAADVVELAKVLGLSRPPQRIEGYDIADLFGRQAVGSMVVFVGGEPDKTQYRRFKIRGGQGQANDVRMLGEVLERRFKAAPGKLNGPRRKKEAGSLLKSSYQNWPLPDLVIVDGGRAQLNVAVRVLKNAGLDILVVAVSKGRGLRSAAAPDKLFFPGKVRPLQLPLSSPAIHIIKRVRDEAHRFAVAYHRLLRKRKLYSPKLST